jgi:hypothetical protein
MKALKILLFIFLFSLVTSLSSCMFPGPGYPPHKGGNGHHEQKEHHGNKSHHDKDDHRAQ